MSTDPIDAKLSEFDIALLELIEVADSDEVCELDVVDAEKKCKRLARELAKVAQERMRKEACRLCDNAVTIHFAETMSSNDAVVVARKLSVSIAALPLEAVDE